MSQKDAIINLLQGSNAMTQGELAEAVYGDKKHMPNIYSALQSLVRDGTVIRNGANPSYYSLGKDDIPAPTNPKKKQREKRDVSGDVISNESIEEASRLVEETDNYGPENELITRCLQRFPENTDPDIVAMKIGLIDITNSTHLSQHKSKISMDELCHIIAAIPNIDASIGTIFPSVTQNTI